jgi:hypothetical protein
MTFPSRLLRSARLSVVQSGPRPALLDADSSAAPSLAHAAADPCRLLRSARLSIVQSDPRPALLGAHSSAPGNLAPAATAWPLERATPEPK